MLTVLMRKKIIITMLMISCLGLYGCGNKEEAVVEPTEVIEEFTVNRNSDIPNIIELSKTEILAMTAEEVKASVEEYLPNYRTTYKISSTREMSNEDWLQLRDIICIQLYGSLLDGIPTEVEEDFIQL